MNSTSFPKPASPGFNLSGGGSFNHADRSASLSTASPSKPNSSESSSSSEGKKKGGISSDIEEFLAELTMENSSAPVDFGLPSTPNAAAKQLAAAIDLEEMDNEDKGEDETAEVSDPWALAPNEWPQMEEEKPQGEGKEI